MQPASYDKEGQAENQLFKKAGFCNPFLPLHLTSSNMSDIWPVENNCELAGVQGG